MSDAAPRRQLEICLLHEVRFVRSAFHAYPNNFSLERCRCEALAKVERGEGVLITCRRVNSAVAELDRRRIPVRSRKPEDAVKLDTRRHLDSRK